MTIPAIYTPTGGRWGHGRLDGLPLSGDISSPFGAREPFRVAAGLDAHKGTDVVPDSEELNYPNTQMFSPFDFDLRFSAGGPTGMILGTYFVGEVLDPDDGKRYRFSVLHMDETEWGARGRSANIVVKRGDPIGTVGNTGTGSRGINFSEHAHMGFSEVGPNTYVDIIPFLTKNWAGSSTGQEPEPCDSGVIAEMQMLLNTIPILRSDDFTKEQALDAVEREVQETLIAAGDYE